MVPTSINFTPEQIDALIDALPGISDRANRILLAKILEEWGRVDLVKHLSRQRPEQTRQLQRRILTAAENAKALVEALRNLGDLGRVMIGMQMAELESSGEYDEIQRYVGRLEEETPYLEKLSEAAANLGARCTPPRLRHSSAIGYLVLQDLAAIFKYATGATAERRVRGEDHPEAGREYGPFWALVSTAWPMIFGSRAGLSAAFKRWAAARTKYGEQSPVIANIHMRHREWQIYRS